jgi:ion channel-forming bestrophin family protein
MDMKSSERLEKELSRYNDFPLVQDLMRYEQTRDDSFRDDRLDHLTGYPKGNGSWLETLCVLRGRALDNIFVPWLLVTLHSTAVVVIFELTPLKHYDMEEAVGDLGSFYGLVLNVVLSFLLVFRLNRAAARYWQGRECWGQMIGIGRSMVSGILSHGCHEPVIRDEAIRWTAATSIYTMVFMRGERDIPEGVLAGILEDGDIRLVENVPHMPLYATERIRDALQRLFVVTAETPPSLAHAWTVQRDQLERNLNGYMNCFGAMERIRATPLPVVYVAHLRTFLLLHLFMFPYVFGPVQKWATIPLTMITAFAFLGIEGASMEVENPFKKGRVNSLSMDAFAQVLIQNIQQQAKTKADLELLMMSQATLSTVQ